jgi:hypothetical protein
MTPLDPPAPSPAEQSLLGAILIVGASAIERAEPMTPERFESRAHALAWNAITEVAADGLGVDLTTVVERLRTTGRLEGAGGSGYVSSLIDRVPDVDNVAGYARLVREEAARRVARGAKAALPPPAGASAPEELDRAEAAALARVEEIRAARAELAGTNGSKSLWLSPAALRRELAEIANTRVTTGIPTLDKSTLGGLPGGAVSLLVGPVGSCKTAFAVQLGLSRARKTGRPCFAYMPDQGGMQPLTRLAETYGDIVGVEAAFTRFSLEVDPFLRVIDERLSGVGLLAFRDAVLAAGDVGAVIIDTPQTVALDEEGDERAVVDRTMDVAREIAAKLVTHVLVPSHANRASTAARKKEDRTMERSAGLGSAKLEHRSQVVLFMEKRETEGESTEIDALFAKVSFGRAGARMRLLLDPLSWTLGEIDFVEEKREEAEKTVKRREEKKARERADRTTAIMAAVEGSPDPRGVGVSWARIKESWSGRTADLPGTLDVMVEDGRLECYPGPKPVTGGRPPKFYRLGGGAP